jgi:hypothetical protein
MAIVAAAVGLFACSRAMATSPYNPDPNFTTNTLAANDDSSTPAVNIGFSANFFGTTYSQLYVNNNGNMTFLRALSEYTPTDLTTDTGTPIIAPYFADVDTRGTGSGLVTYGTSTVGGHAAFGVDWPNVGYYDEQTNKLNTFQAILIDRSDVAAGDFDIEFNYSQIQWETGSASGGTNGLGGTSAAVGYSAGTGVSGTYAQLTGSFVHGALLDGGPDALVSNSNDGVPGQYIFEVRAGNVIVPPPTNAVPLPAAFWQGMEGLGLIVLVGAGKLLAARKSVA